MNASELPEMKQLLEQFFLLLNGKRPMKGNLDMNGYMVKGLPFGVSLCVGDHHSVPYEIDTDEGDGGCSYSTPMHTISTTTQGIGIWYETQRCYHFPRIRFLNETIKKFKYCITSTLGDVGYQIWATKYAYGEAIPLFNTGYIENPDLGHYEIPIDVTLSMAEDFTLSFYGYVENTTEAQFARIYLKDIGFELETA